MAHILMVLPNTIYSNKMCDLFQYESTCMKTYRIFKESGLVCSVASPEGGDIGFNNKENNLNDDAFSELRNTQVVENIMNNKYEGLFLVGNHDALESFQECESLKELTISLLTDGKPVAAVAHGSAVFTKLFSADGTPYIERKKVTAATNQEERLSQDNPSYYLESRIRELGATFVSAPPFVDNVIIHDNLITAQNLQSAIKAANEFIQLVN